MLLNVLNSWTAIKDLIKRNLNDGIKVMIPMVLPVAKLIAKYEKKIQKKKKKIEKVIVNIIILYFSFFVISIKNDKINYECALNDFSPLFSMYYI